MSDDSDDVYMFTLATLDNPIRDEYDRDEMEELDRIVWDHPSFNDISAWETYRPFDENVRVHYPHSLDLQKGTIFWKKEDAMLAVQRYSILNRVEYRVRKSDTTKLVFECRKGEEVCPWRLRVVVMQRTSYWMVRNEGDVECDECKHKVFHRTDTKFNLARLWALHDFSQNNFVKWDVTPLDNSTMQVNHIFWPFSERILAFNHCRPLLSTDGTHMYEKYNTKLLVAIGLDANNHILPLAFALVESENTSSWKWFMSCIREGVTQREGLCVVSDRHNGILAAMRELEWQEPKAYHRVCVRHLQSNFMTKVNDEILKAKLDDVAYEKELKFKKKFAELLQLLHDKPLARKWLEDMDVDLWTQAFDHVRYTFKQTSAYFVKRYQSPYNNDGELFPPKICERLAELRAMADFHIVMLYNPKEPYHVHGLSRYTYKVCRDKSGSATRTWSRHTVSI
ncbi:hypothetical protein QQ045_018408 [Rhodiola kirilowii]